MKQYNYNINYTLLFQELGKNSSLEDISKRGFSVLYKIESYEDFGNKNLNHDNNNNESDINYNNLENILKYFPPKNNALFKNLIKDNKKDDNEYVLI